MELKKMSGGMYTDVDELTAEPAHVLEGETFLGHGNEDPQPGELPDMARVRDSPTFMHGESIVPIHRADLAFATTDSNGASQIVFAPPWGSFPGNEKAFVGVSPEELGISPEKIPVGMTLCLVKGSWGSDSDFSSLDLREGKVAYGKDGRIIGAAKENGSISKTLAAGESVKISEGYYGEGKVAAKDLASQTKATLKPEQAQSGATYWKDGELCRGTLTDRGQYQYGGFGSGDGYYAINTLPEGIYRKNGATWAPEARITAANLRAGLGITADKIVKGATVAGVAGNRAIAFTNKISANAWALSRTTNQTAYNEQSFVMPKDGYVIYGGESVCDRSSSRFVRCEVYLNNVLIDNRNCNSDNTWIARTTMINCVRALKKGDVVKVAAETNSYSPQYTSVWAVGIYF